MEWRRRVSGDPIYRSKAAEKNLDEATNVQAQRWLEQGGRLSWPPPIAASDKIMEALDAATAAGARADSPAMQRATALLAALEAGPGAAGGIDLEPRSTRTLNDASLALPMDFDGTRQAVARADLAARRLRQQGAAAEENAAPSDAPGQPEQPEQQQPRASSGIGGPSTQERAQNMREPSPKSSTTSGDSTGGAAGAEGADAKLNAKLDMLMAPPDPFAGLGGDDDSRRSQVESEPQIPD